MSGSGRNAHAQRCCDCGEMVPAGAGYLSQTAETRYINYYTGETIYTGRRWIVSCEACQRKWEEKIAAQRAAAELDAVRRAAAAEIIRATQ